MSPAPAAFSSRIGHALDVGVDLVEGGHEGLGHRRQGRLEPAPPVAPDVQHQAVGPHAVGRGQVGRQARPRLGRQLGVG